MALEDSINLLTAAVTELTKAILLEKEGDVPAPAPALEPEEPKPAAKKKATTKKKRGRPAKKPEPEPENEGVTKEDITAVVNQIKEAAGPDYRDTFLGILENYGATKFSEVEEADYEEFLNDCNASLAEIQGIAAESSDEDDLGL